MDITHNMWEQGLWSPCDGLLIWSSLIRHQRKAVAFLVKGPPPLTLTLFNTLNIITVQYSTVQYSTVQYSTVQCLLCLLNPTYYYYYHYYYFGPQGKKKNKKKTVQYITIQYSTVQYSTVVYYVQHLTVQSTVLVQLLLFCTHSTGQKKTVKKTVQYITIYSTVQYSTVQ